MIRTLLILCFALTTLGCNPPEREDENVPTVEGVRLDRQALAPESAPDANAVLLVDGTEFDVELRHSHRDETVIVELLPAGSELPLEVEEYAARQRAFYLVAIGAERFEPPLPLIQYGERTGEAWTWTGALINAGSGGELDAEAQVVTRDTTINMPGGARDVIEVTVGLHHAETVRPPEPNAEPQLTVARDLRFWIQQGRGVVGREFDGISTRHPAPEES